MTEPLLSVEGVEARYGRTLALSDVDLEIHEGEAVALLGPNGAGKTTLANAISGFVRLARGRIRFLGKDLAKVPAHRVTRGGILHVPEGRGVLRDLTVRENLVLGGLGARRAATPAIDRVLERFPRLGERLKQPAGSLSGGEQQMLVLARAMIGQPRLLVLDEPSLGLAPQLVRHTFDLLGELKAEGLSLLVIEQNFPMSLKLADRAYVLSNGRVVMAGASARVREDPALRAAYLGGDA
jgi:branched-chain amino acid transport system ATP-binding protein